MFFHFLADNAGFILFIVTVFAAIIQLIFRRVFYVSGTFQRKPVAINAEVKNADIIAHNLIAEGAAKITVGPCHEKSGLEIRVEGLEASASAISQKHGSTAEHSKKTFTCTRLQEEKAIRLYAGIAFATVILIFCIGVLIFSHDADQKTWSMSTMSAFAGYLFKSITK